MATDERTERLRKRKQKLPNLVGLMEKDARLVLRHRGFFDRSRIGTPQEGDPRVEIRYIKSFSPYGTVVGQNPAKGLIIDTDEQIELLVSMECLMDYLPAVFQRRQVGGENFLREFLWIFQHIFHSIEHKIDVLHDYFEVFETPGEFLPWLAGWVAFTLDGDWDETKRRLFLKKAVELYRIRGTVKGLETFVEMYIGTRPKIVENAWPMDGFQVGVHSTIGVESAIIPPINKTHCFIVEVPLDPVAVTDDQIIKIHQIISQEKPAHTIYFLKFTGVPQEKKAWFGPVIGAYRVTSTRDETLKVELPEEGGEPAAGAPSGVGETSLEERLAEKRRLLAERRKRRFGTEEGGTEGEAEGGAETTSDTQRPSAPAAEGLSRPERPSRVEAEAPVDKETASDDERLARRRRLRTLGESDDEEKSSADDILARRRGTRPGTADGEPPTQVLDAAQLGSRLRPTREGPAETEAAPQPGAETTLTRLRRLKETTGESEEKAAEPRETTLSRLRRMRETGGEGTKPVEPGKSGDETTVLPSRLRSADRAKAVEPGKTGDETTVLPSRLRSTDRAKPVEPGKTGDETTVLPGRSPRNADKDKKDS